MVLLMHKFEGFDFVLLIFCYAPFWFCKQMLGMEFCIWFSATLPFSWFDLESFLLYMLGMELCADIAQGWMCLGFHVFALRHMENDDFDSWIIEPLLFWFVALKNVFLSDWVFFLFNVCFFYLLFWAVAFDGWILRLGILMWLLLWKYLQLLLFSSSTVYC